MGVFYRSEVVSRKKHTHPHTISTAAVVRLTFHENNIACLVVFACPPELLSECMVSPDFVSFSLRQHLRNAYATYVLACALLMDQFLLTQGLRQEFLQCFLGASLREIILIEICGTTIAYALAYAT